MQQKTIKQLYLKPSRLFLKLYLIIILLIPPCFLNANLIHAIDISEPFGEIEEPPGTKEWGKEAVIDFVNAIIKFVIAIAGAWLLFKIILSGINIVHNVKDPTAFYEEIQKIIWTIFGLFLVASTAIIAGWVSKSLFGDKDYILNPEKHLEPPEHI